MDEETRRIHRLLSDGKLSGPEAEEILQNVLAAGRRKQPNEVRALPIRYWAGAATALCAAAVALLMLLPREPGADLGESDERMLESGDLSPLRVTCAGGALAACPTSGELVYAVTGKAASGFLSAYVEPIGHQAERVFHYSEQDGSPKLPTETAVHALGVPGPGRYRVHAVLADRPLTREELVQATKAGAGGTEVRARTRVEIVVTE